MKGINAKRWWPIKEKSLKLCILQANILLELEIIKRIMYIFSCGIITGETYPVAFLEQCLGVCSPHTSCGTLVAVLKEKERILLKERPRVPYCSIGLAKDLLNICTEWCSVCVPRIYSSWGVSLVLLYGPWKSLGDSCALCTNCCLDSHIMQLPFLRCTLFSSI